MTDLERMTSDPVCGMAVAQDRGPHYRHDATTYWFCSVECRGEFALDTERFIETNTTHAATAAPR